MGKNFMVVKVKVQFGVISEELRLGINKILCWWKSCMLIKMRVHRCETLGA